ncbi:uroporphyrinogen decarboxylase family protein [Desulfobacula sp.]|uniref:uroporphyrinogen decarboxylase family protein n=1 Tax=Desulfobacula sp. TaxID=2593537 RepID=UPI0026389A75|nr:uroporphyrinogen decarboxylase family protein [Desulfobacula sp.]
MKERWTKEAADAGEKLSQQFDIWLAAENIPFVSPEAEALYRERVELYRDAIQMKTVPKRIPVCPSAGSFPIEYAGITWKEAMYDYKKLGYAWRKYHDDFDPDGYSAPRTIAPGKSLEILGLELYRWAGGGLRDDQEYQFVEKEYMRDDEYYDLIDDPTGFFLNTYFPRIFKELGALKKMPMLPPIHELPVIPSGIIPFGMPDVQAAFARLCSAGEDVNHWLAEVTNVSIAQMANGKPSFSAGFTKAPFDVIGDSLRGTKGVLMDMFRHPEELVEACERITPFMIKSGAAGCKAAGHVMPFIPLHKGADTFMSEDQFMTFYWPTLRKLIIGLSNEGVVPQLFVEGAYNRRLDLIDDLPPGKVVWWFDATDMAAAKKTVGRTNCIAGNVPLDILCTGTPDDVKVYCKDLIDTAGKDGGFIMTSGAGVQGAKAENVKAMIDFSKKYGVYS